MTGTSVTFDIIGRDRSGSAAFDKLARSANRADGAMSKFSAGAAKVAKAGLAATAVAGGLAAKLGYDAVMAASDLNETLSKSQVIFGKHADSMASWAARADQSMGLSQQAALNAATGFGDMFSQIGFTNDQAVKMSKGVVQLSADLGSFNNLETADVAERMSAAFRGEFDSLQALIPNINAARVETEALRMTGKKSADALTAQEKAAATLAIVTRDGARAQGDFARTSDGLANQTKILKAQLDNASASFGQKLLPMAVDFAQFANRELVPAIEKGAEWLGDRLPGAIDTVVAAGQDMRKAVAPAVEEIVEALGNLADEGDAAGRLFNNVFIPALSTTAEVVGEVVNFVDNLPGPVKEIGVQAAFAAYGLSKMNSAMVAVKGSGFVTTMMDAEKRTDGLKSAARSAAGVAGILALTSAMGDASDEGASFGDVMKGVAGGAGIGAMFGPIGALVGAGAGGGLAALVGAFSETSEEAADLRREQAKTDALAEQKRKIDDLAGSLDELTGAYASTTRAAVFQRLETDGLIEQGAEYGLSARTLVDAALGQEAATGRVTRAINAQGKVTHNLYGANGQIIGTYTAAATEVGEFGAKLGIVSDDLRAARRATRAAADATESLAHRLGITKKAMKDIPRDVRIKIRDDVPDSLREIRKLARESNKLDRKTIKILLQAANLPVTEKNIRDIQDEIDKTDKKSAKPKFDADARSFDAREKHVRGLLESLDKQKPTPKADLDLTLFYNQRSALMTSLNTIPDEEVIIWTTRKNRTGNGHANGTASAPAGWAWVGEQGPELMRFKGGEQVVPHHRSVAMAAAMRTAYGNVQSVAGTSMYASAAPRRVVHVFEVRVSGDLDLSKTKAQIEGIATEVFAEEFQEERRFERTQR